MKNIILIAVLAIGSIWCTEVKSGELSSIDPAVARQYFDNLKSISDSDAGHLWGIRLFGPTMLVDPNSRMVVANQPDKGGKLTSDHGVYIGKLEPEVNISNTATEWSGVHWTMVSWNAISANDPYDRARLLIHESWHRIQNDLGIPSTTSANVYLDGTDGRVALLLEFRALIRALQAQGDSVRRTAIGDALTFRRYRQAQFPANNEDAFERHEGLAEYTGLKLCGLPDSLLMRIAAKKLQLAEGNSGLANSFAYLTGPALGLLLDHYDTGWREKARHGADLPTLLAAAVNWEVPVDKSALQADAELVGQRYDAAGLKEEQESSAQNQEKTVEGFRSRLLAHGRLIIPNNNVNFSYNPQEKLAPFDTIGVMYQTMRLTGDFGVLEASSGIVRANNWQFFMVVAPPQFTGDSIIWDGYTLKLQAGWKVTNKQSGAFVIEKR